MMYNGHSNVNRSFMKYVNIYHKTFKALIAVIAVANAIVVLIA